MAFKLSLKKVFKLARAFIALGHSVVTVIHEDDQK